jgi:Fur family transcriptional regulator, ferric uptake regulator
MPAKDLREASQSMPQGAKAATGRHSTPAATGGREQRVTKQRLAVSAALDQLNDFVSTQELYRILQDQGTPVSLATAYRILQSLADDGLVDVLRSGEGEAVYRRCAVSGHHHHLLCRSCGKAVEVEAPAVETWAARTAQDHGFTEVAHTVEIFGLCPDCTAAKAAAP